MSLLDLVDDLFKYAKENNKHFSIEYNRYKKYEDEDDIFTIRTKNNISNDILKILKNNHIHIDPNINKNLISGTLKFVYFEKTIREIYNEHVKNMINMDDMENEIRLYLIELFRIAAKRNSLRMIIGRGTVLTFSV